MKGISVRGIVFSALFAALFIVFSYVRINIGSPVPITLQNFAVMLAGGILGAVYGFFSIFMVLFFTLLGLPLIAGEGGLAKLLGATGGFLWAFPLSALFIGYFVSKIKQNGIIGFILIFLTMEVFGSFFAYVLGVPWFMHVTGFGFEKAMGLSCYPYLPGDAVKAVLAALVVMAIRRIYPPERIIGN